MAETRTDLVTNVTRLTWHGYLSACGLERMTVHRWLEDDNRRIEACYNIIKACKGIAVDLQRGQNG